MFLQFDDAHDPVFSRAALRLAEVHWRLLKAAQRLTARTTESVPVEGTGFHSLQRTEFGEEVGRDEINWWVFKKETNLGELRTMSERALAAVQALKEATDGLRGRRWDSYEALLRALREFVDQREEQIATLQSYLSWLEDRDPLAPSIMFSYRVWGSTRRSDRWIDLQADAPAEEVSGTMRILAEIALGLRGAHGLYAWEKATQEAEEDAASREAEHIHEAEVLSRASWQITDALTTYVTEIRDSLRNILLDIEECLGQRDLLYSDGFWRRFVQRAIAPGTIERQLWDLKETLTMWHVAGVEKERARVRFAEDVAAFANGRGGVLVVGVTDRPPREVVGIGDTRAAEARLEFATKVLSQQLDYPRSITFIRQVSVPREDGTERTCLLIVVAQAYEDVGVRGLDGQFTYPVRRETGIERVARRDLGMEKMHLKSDNHHFLRELVRFVAEN